MVEAWCFGCCQAHQGLPVGFLLLRYSVLCTVESLSCFISFLYLDLHVLGDDAWISLGSFMQTKHLCVLIHIWTKGEVGAPWNRFKPSSKIFLLTVPRLYFFCGSFVLFMSCVFHAFASVHCCLVVTRRERADLLALVCDVYCDVVTFPQMWYLIVSIPVTCSLSYLYSESTAPDWYRIMKCVSVYLEWKSYKGVEIQTKVWF